MTNCKRSHAGIGVLAQLDKLGYQAFKVKCQFKSNLGSCCGSQNRKTHQAVEDWAMILMNTKVKERVPGESRNMLFIQPYSELESAYEKDVVQYAYHLALSGTSHIVYNKTLGCES